MSGRRLIALAPFLLVGCYLSHSSDVYSGPTPARPDSGVDASAPRGDGAAPIDAAPIDAARVDAARTDAAFLDGGVCPGRALGVEVRVEPITSDRGRCDVSHAVGAAIYRIEPAPADRGIRIRADYCPDADADCRCDLVVANVGVDLADRVLIPSSALTLDVGPTSLRVTTLPTCECLGCPCSYALVFDAEDALLPTGTDELEISQGGLVCPEPAACVSPTWALRASSVGDSVEVPTGSDGVVAGIVNVRSVRDVDIYGPCAACAECGSLRASWVAWIRH